MAGADAEQQTKQPSAPLKAGDLVLVLARFVAFVPAEPGRPHAGATVRFNICEQDFGFSQRIVRLEDVSLAPAAAAAA